MCSLIISVEPIDAFAKVRFAGNGVAAIHALGLVPGQLHRHGARQPLSLHVARARTTSGSRPAIAAQNSKYREALNTLNASAHGVIRCAREARSLQIALHPMAQEVDRCDHGEDKDDENDPARHVECWRILYRRAVIDRGGWEKDSLQTYRKPD